MAKESLLIKVWVKHNDPNNQLFSYGKDLEAFQKRLSSFLLLNDIVLLDNGREPADDLFYCFRLALHYSKEIESFNVQQPNIDFFQSKIGDGSRKDTDNDAEFTPIIHILQENSDSFLTEQYSKEHTSAPRFRYVVDNSIWNYLAVNASVFNDIVSVIVSNYKEGYYDLLIAREVADLNARLTKSSYLYERKDKLGGSTSKGHGADVSPFLFHSESLLKTKLDTNLVSKYKWRLLLLDDRIDKEKTAKDKNGKTIRTGILSSNDPKLIKTKDDILRQRISEMGIGSCECILAKKYEQLPNQDSTIQIVCVETVNEALQLMEKYEFDIILLDYLLEGDYGYHLLKKLNKVKWGSSQILVGPQKKNFFMFISAFTTAVNERLTLEGLSRDEEWWTIGEGACPTNTPELFKYRLLHLMERRLDQTGIKDLSENKIMKMAQSIYDDEKEDSSTGRISAVRKRAYDAYHYVLGLHYDYTVLKSDKELSSLVNSFMENKVHMGAMLEHFLQLVHLTAFGTVRQWPEIWEEYKFFVRTINVDKESIRDFSKCIEDYLIELKSA